MYLVGSEVLPRLEPHGANIQEELWDSEHRSGPVFIKGFTEDRDTGKAERYSFPVRSRLLLWQAELRKGSTSPTFCLP